MQPRSDAIFAIAAFTLDLPLAGVAARRDAGGQDPAEGALPATVRAGVGLCPGTDCPALSKSAQRIPKSSSAVGTRARHDGSHLVK
jgi:hypothetical protein